MESIMDNSIIFIAIVINVLGGILTLAYIIKTCTPTGLSSDNTKNYLEQIKSCFKGSLVLFLFSWFISSTDTNNLIYIGVKSGIFIWCFLLAFSIVCMLPYMKYIIKGINESYVTNLRKISSKAIQYTIILIFVQWFIA